jgi:hypothetical protein
MALLQRRYVQGHAAARGRSSRVSMDVADTIEGMMPQLMEIFAGTDEVVKFEPVGPEDVKAAEQETDYINHVFMNQNPGFLVLYSFIKDALLSKVGVSRSGGRRKNARSGKPTMTRPRMNMRSLWRTLMLRLSSTRAPAADSQNGRPTNGPGGSLEGGTASGLEAVQPWNAGSATPRKHSTT